MRFLDKEVFFIIQNINIFIGHFRFGTIDFILFFLSYLLNYK